MEAEGNFTVIANQAGNDSDFAAEPVVRFALVK